MLKFPYRLLTIIAALSTLFPLSAKAEWNDSIRYHGEIGMDFAGGAHTPFWMANNKYGLSSIEKNNGYLRLGAFKDMDRSKDRRFSW
ncbi:MAG: hypothetical protein K2J03_03710, partial [Muribaculaceae bacterium]|nr:hypothetical protein [Muribaculaceae bacterium]